MTLSRILCVVLSLTLVAANEHQMNVAVRDGFRYFTTNGIPDHTTGQFPNRGNPNAIAAQQYTFRVTMTPKVSQPSRDMRGFLFGVALSGVPFDPGTAEFWNNDRSSGWNYEAKSGKINLGLDHNNAHVQPGGAYHYHGMPTGVVTKHSHGHAKQMVLVGYAADGFPIYNQFGHTDPNDASSPLREIKSSYRLRQGIRTSGPGGKYDGTYVQDYEYVENVGDLDDCNGRFGVTPEYPNGIYHYHLTEDYPFVPRRFRGTPDDSFRKQMGGGPGPGGDRGERGNRDNRGDRRPPPRGGRRPPPRQR